MIETTLARYRDIEARPPFKARDIAVLIHRLPPDEMDKLVQHLQVAGIQRPRSQEAIRAVILRLRRNMSNGQTE